MANEQQNRAGHRPIRKEDALYSIEEGVFNDEPKWGSLMIDILTVEENDKSTSANQSDYQNRRAS